MTKEGRHNFILDQLKKRDSVSVTDLSTQLEVSMVTIRKDLSELEQAGKLYRSHGKAKLLNPFASNRSVNEKENINPEEKNAIGREAAKLITADDSIAFASGTTIHACARNMKPIHRLTVVSASIEASHILGFDESVDIIQLGGMLRHSSLSVVGQYAESILSGFSYTKLYLGVDGIDFDYGITTTDLREAELNQKMMSAAQKTIVVADFSKFGRRGFAKICNIEDIDIIITDSKVPKAVVHRLEEMGIELIIAEL